MYNAVGIATSVTPNQNKMLVKAANKPLPAHVKNAMPLVDQGSAVILPQKDLVPSILLQTIRGAIRRKETMQKHADLAGTQEMNDAASRIAEYCFTLYEYTKHHKK